MRMQDLLPEDYNFFPTTYCLPNEYKDFNEEVRNQKNPRTYIIKPCDKSLGKGIFLTRNPDEIPDDHAYLVQKYIPKPHLIKGYKYDFRVYVFVNCISPLRIYVYKEGLATLASDKYQKPSDKNFADLSMHLTNFTDTDEIGSQ